MSVVWWAMFFSLAVFDEDAARSVDVLFVVVAVALWIRVQMTRP